MEDEPTAPQLSPGFFSPDVETATRLQTRPALTMNINFTNTHDASSRGRKGRTDAAERAWTAKSFCNGVYASGRRCWIVMEFPPNTMGGVYVRKSTSKINLRRDSWLFRVIISCVYLLQISSFVWEREAATTRKVNLREYRVCFKRFCGLSLRCLM